MRKQLQPFFVGAQKQLDEMITHNFKPLVLSLGLAYVEILHEDFFSTTNWVLFPEDIAAEILRHIARMCKKGEDPAMALERLVTARHSTAIEFKSSQSSQEYRLSFGERNIVQTNLGTGFRRSCSFFTTTGQPFEPPFLECGEASMDIRGTQTRKVDRDNSVSRARFSTGGFLKALDHQIFHRLDASSVEFRQVAERYGR